MAFFRSARSASFAAFCCSISSTIRFLSSMAFFRSAFSASIALFCCSFSSRICFLSSMAFFLSAFSASFSFFFFSFSSMSLRLSALVRTQADDFACDVCLCGGTGSFRSPETWPTDSAVLVKVVIPELNCTTVP